MADVAMRVFDSMKCLSAFFAILVAALMAGSAIGAEHTAGGDEPQTEYTLLAHTDPDPQVGGYFTFEDDDAADNETRNPELVVPAGEEITITLRANDTGQHNFIVEGEEEGSEFVTTQGDEVTYNFTAPMDEGSTWRYWCEVHEEQGMEGTIRVAEEEREDDPDDPFFPEDPDDPPPDDDDAETPAPGIIAVIGVFALAALFYRRRK